MNKNGPSIGAEIMRRPNTTGLYQKYGGKDIQTFKKILKYVILDTSYNFPHKTRKNNIM